TAAGSGQPARAPWQDRRAPPGGDSGASPGPPPGAAAAAREQAGTDPLRTVVGYQISGAGAADPAVRPPGNLSSGDHGHLKGGGHPLAAGRARPASRE